MPRNTKTLRYDWKFKREDVHRGAEPELDDSDWQTVRVPHDWAIEGPFDRAHDLQHLAILEDGERKKRDHTGRTAGLPHVGVAWYRRRIEVPEDDRGKRLFIEFDGVMSHSTIYVNGEEVGSWPYGYASFRFDITDEVHPGKDNQLAVRVDNKPCASRWYPGAGIYRHVRLVHTEPIHVAGWGTTVTTPLIERDRARIHVRTRVVNHTGEQGECRLVTSLLDPDGAEIVETECKMSLGETADVEQELFIADPVRWDVDDPALYRAVTRVLVDGEQTDLYETRFGIRDIEFDALEGFFLNGRALKLKGVCMHHDLGALGTAVNRRAIERQLEGLKAMGCNAIRTAHNPPAPELLDLCDEMGILVIDEAFDEWRVGKVDNGYHTLFDEWAERDLRAMIRRDRNHPCVIMWSIGNEIGDQREGSGGETARRLTEICHAEDPTRPVTAGFNAPDAAIENGLAAAVDVPGWNYEAERYEQLHDQHPDWIMYGSETESCVSSRGEYYFPVEEERGVTRDSHHVTSYDLAAPPWGYSPDYEFAAQEDCPFMLGQFTWTGRDYLGESTPYKTEWPSRSSYFGIIDLAGFPKDRYYLYRSHWAEGETLHLLPHWNWEGREGQNVPVHCYTSHDRAELFVNGVSQGKRQKDPAAVFGRYRLIWDEVRYEPGELKVVALDIGGNPISETVVETAGKPARVEIEPDRTTIRADGEDLCFLRVSIRDQEGRLCPRAENLVKFAVEGPAEIAGVDNGDQTSLAPFQASDRRAFNGLCLLILRSLRNEPGEVRVRGESEGLAGGIVQIQTVEPD
jgi:beta-galactosidase